MAKNASNVSDFLGTTPMTPHMHTLTFIQDNNSRYLITAWLSRNKSHAQTDKEVDKELFTEGKSWTTHHCSMLCAYCTTRLLYVITHRMLCNTWGLTVIDCGGVQSVARGPIAALGQCFTSPWSNSKNIIEYGPRKKLVLTLVYFLVLALGGASF